MDPGRHEGASDRDRLVGQLLEGDSGVAVHDRLPVAKTVSGIGDEAGNGSPGEIAALVFLRQGRTSGRHGCCDDTDTISPLMYEE